MAYQPKSYRKFVATAATATLVATAIAPAALAASSFTDVAPKYKEAVDYLFDNGITKGKTEELFGTHQNITRGELAIWLTRALGLETAGAAPSGFADTAGTYYDAHVSVLKEEGILDGLSADKFGVNDYVTRGQMAKLLSNAYGLTSEEAAPFTDMGQWAPFINGLYAFEITSGKTETTFGTAENITRGDLAIFLFRADSLLVEDLAPEFNYEGQETIAVAYGAEFTAPVVTAEDDIDEEVEVVSVITDAAGNELQTIDTKKPGTYTITYTAEDSAENVSELVLTVVVAEAVTPAVESVSAINGTQLVVKFSQKVDEDNLGTYTFSDGKTATAELQADEKSVLLTLATAYDNTKAHTVAVTVEGAVVAGTENTFPIFTSVVKFEDKVAAGVAEVKSVTKGATADKATITFTEPVKEGLIKLNGTSYQISAYLGGKESVSSVELTGLSLDASQTHNLEVVNLKDAAGNVVALTTKQFSVTKDAVAPVVSSVEAYGDYQVLVTFDKKIAAGTVAAGDVKVADELLNDIPVANFAALNGDTTGTKFVVTLDKNDAKVSGLYTNKTSRALTLVFADKSVDDVLGNQLAAVTKSVTLTKDTTAPSVTGITYKKNADKEVETITVTFDENIADVVDATFLSKFTVVNANGVQKNGILTGASVTVTGKTAVIDITDVALYGQHSFQIAAGAAQDLALVANNSKAYSATVDFGAAPSTSGTFELPANAIDDSTENVIEITFANAVKGGAVAGSATDVNNYSINGKSLPAGTTITLDDAQKVATITLAEGFTANDADAIFTINNVQQLTGEVIKPVTTTVSVADNVAPVLQSARVIDADTIELTYSEALAAVTLGNSVLDELEVYEGSSKKTLTSATATNVTGYSKKIVVDLDAALDLTKEISVKTITTAATVDIADLNNDNAHKANVTVVVAK